MSKPKREVLLKERLERLEKVIRVKEPDRVPLMMAACFLPVSYLGTTYEKIAFDYQECKKGAIKVASDFGFDMFGCFSGLEGFIFSLALIESHPDIAPFVRFLTGPMHDILQDKYTKWPGRETSENTYPQFLGGKFMEPEEYGKLIEDPLGFINEVLLPRVCRSLEKPNSAKAYGAMVKLGMDVAKYGAMMQELTVELKNLGFPSFPFAWSYSPLDLIGDFMRHVTDVVVDLHRIPDKVQQATEVLTPLAAKVGVVSGQVPPEVKKFFGTDIVLAFIPLHLNSILSPKLYNDYYWPALKKVIGELIKAGLTPFVFYEGDHTPHLETMRELPKGKTVAYFERADLRKVKEVLGGHTCIMGGIPGSLLAGGTPEKVREHVKSLLEDLKPGGGFALAPAEASSLDVKPENIKALTDAVKKYGKY